MATSLALATTISETESGALRWGLDGLDRSHHSTVVMTGLVTSE